MKKKLKRGFTIVELVIVIAVIGILAAVLIPTFSGLINKANLSADEAMVRNINNQLAIAEVQVGKNPTMHEALLDAQEAGYIVANINAKSKGNELVWDQTLDRFALLEKETGNVIAGEVRDINNKVALWRIASSYTAGGYSIYLKDGYNGSATIAGVNTGIDVGYNENISSISYVNNSSQSVVIRTNGGALTVNAPNDTVKHYGSSDNVNVIAVAPSHSFHEFGRVSGAVKLTSGRFVAETGSETTTIVVDASSYEDIEIAIDNGSSVGALVDFNNIVPSNISDVFEYVVTNSNTTNTVEEIVSSVAYIESDGVKTYYNNLQDALNVASNGETVVLTNDITKEGSGSIFTYLSTTEDRSATLDLNGKIIKAKLENAASCQVFKIGSLNADKSNYQHTATLTVIDSNAPMGGYKTGAIIAMPDRYSDSWNVAVSTFSVSRLGSLVVESGKILVEGADIQVNPNADNPYAIDVLTNTGSQNANLTINGGYISSNMPTGVGVRAFCNSSTGTVNITMNGGYVFGDSRAFMLQYPSNNKKCKLECVINSGTLESATRALDVLNFNSSAVANSEFNITVNGGEFISHNDTDRVKFPGSDILYISYTTNVTAHINFTDNR